MSNLQGQEKKRKQIVTNLPCDLSDKVKYRRDVPTSTTVPIFAKRWAYPHCLQTNSIHRVVKINLSSPGSCSLLSSSISRLSAILQDPTGVSDIFPQLFHSKKLRHPRDLATPSAVPCSSTHVPVRYLVPPQEGKTEFKETPAASPSTLEFTRINVFLP